MHHNLTKKTYIFITSIYGVIVALINYIGYLIVSSQQMPVVRNEALEYWIGYLYAHSLFVNLASVLSFVIPIILIISFVVNCSTNKMASRIINLPLTFSLIGSLGWFLSFCFQCILLFYVYGLTGISMHSIAISSFLNVIQSCIFISTLAFMILTTIHRVYILPKFFPEGGLSKYEGSRKVSTSLLMTFFYLSAGVFPIFYLVSMLRNYSLSEGFDIDYSIYYMVIGIVCLSCVLLATVISYISTPLRKFNAATEIIQKEHYGQKIDVISNDDFGELADNFNAMSVSLLEKNKRIVAIQDSIIKGMAVMVESRDNSTGGHINRTSECVRVFVNQMKASGKFEISDSYAKALIKAAPMHDLGKIAVDDRILRKPGRFEPDEFEKMKKHSAEGARIVAQVLDESDDDEFKNIAINVAHFHHEKWDGSGYPTKKKGEEIPYEARIMALADVFDALVSKRCYKERMDYDKAFSIIEESLGQHFDPVLGTFFISCRKELEELYDALPE